MLEVSHDPERPEGHDSSDSGEGTEPTPTRDADDGGGPQGGCGRQTLHRRSVPHDRPRTEESETVHHLGNDAARITTRGIERG